MNDYTQRVQEPNIAKSCMMPIKTNPSVCRCDDCKKWEEDCFIKDIKGDCIRHDPKNKKELNGLEG